MQFVYNDPILELRRKKLRKNSTREEIAVWNWVKGKKLGVKIRRQFSIGNYIADFCCTELRLVIELDGVHHNFYKEYDRERTFYLKSKGYFVLRIPNSLIQYNLLKAIEIIQEHIYLLSEKNLRISSPDKGRWP